MDDGIGQRRTRWRSAPGDGLRVLLAALALVIVIAGLRAGPGLTWSASWHGPWHDRGHGFALVAGLELTCGALLIALAYRARRAPRPGNPAGRIRTALVRVIVTVMIATVILLLGSLYVVPTVKPRSGPGPGPQPTHTPPPLHRPGGLATAAEVVAFVLLAVVAAALVIAIIVVLRRLRLTRSPLAGRAEELDDDSAAILRRAVEAGRLALGELAEPRMAIINCYLAMERSLARAGAARASTETPQELLARSRAAGLVHTAAADELTGLFYEARFSTHPVSRSARDRAHRALDEISAELAPAGAGAAP